MNNNDGFDWLQEIQRRQHEPAPSFRALALAGLMYAVVIIGLGYYLGHMA
ncbi:hypothetical protein [Microbulbifer sp. SAOS-129_SWC]